MQTICGATAERTAPPHIGANTERKRRQVEREWKVGKRERKAVLRSYRLIDLQMRSQHKSSELCSMT